MANADRPRGFWPYGPVLRANKLEAGSAIYPGDFVSLAADGQIDTVAAGAVILGCALEYASAAGEKIMVSTDPEQLYIGQADESELSSQAVVGTLCDIVATAGDSNVKLSRQEVDSSTLSDGGGNDTGQVLIVAKIDRADNAWGANVDVLVKINEKQAHNQGVADFTGI